MRETGDRGRRPSPYPRVPQAQPPRAVSHRGGKRTRYIAGLSVAAVVAAVSAGLMTTGNAYAEGGDDTVVFNGNCGLIGLGQASKPDKDTVSVTDEDEVTFVNNLGTKAVLLLGKEEVNVPKGGEYTTMLASSTQAVMAPHCLTNITEKAEIVTVTVTAAPDEDTGSDDRGTGGDTGSSDRGSADPGDTNGSGDQSGNGHTGTSDGGQPPVDTDGPVAEDEVPAPDGEKDEPVDTATEDEGTETSGTTDTGGTDTTTGQDTPVEAVDVGTIEESGTSGLLAVLATVSLVGVAVAAIRTLRTNQARA